MAVMRKLLMQLHAVASTGHALDGGIRSGHLKTLYIQHRYSSEVWNPEAWGGGKLHRSLPSHSQTVDTLCANRYLVRQKVASSGTRIPIASVDSRGWINPMPATGSDYLRPD